MGRLKSDQGQLFCSFCLDQGVPDDHWVREIAAVLDLSWVHSELAPHDSHLGRPSIDSVLMIRMFGLDLPSHRHREGIVDSKRPRGLVKQVISG